MLVGTNVMFFRFQYLAGISFLLVTIHLPREYRIYCARSRGARAVNTILPRIERIVTGLSPNKRSTSVKSFLES